MSATVKSVVSEATLALVGDEPGTVSVFRSFKGEPVYGDWTTIVPAADLLAAVATELNVRLVPADAIVIERDELPPTRLTSDGSEVVAGSGEPGTRWMRVAAGADAAMQAALAYFAIHKHLTAHSPIDEAQVQALRSLVSDVVPGISRAEHDAIARRLVEAGVRAPEVTA